MKLQNFLFSIYNYYSLTSSLYSKTKVPSKEALKSLSEAPPYTIDNDLVSIIIPAWNEGDYLNRLLRSIENQTIQNKEVIVCFYKMSTFEMEIVEKYNAKYIEVNQKGIAYARNKASKTAEANIMLHTDADTVFAHDSIERLLNHIQKGFDCSHGFNILYDGDLVNRMAFTVSSLIKPVWWTSGRSIMVTRDAFWSINGFDEDTIVGEDRDLGKRLFLAGYRIAYDKTIPVATSSRRINLHGFKSKWSELDYYPPVR